MSITTKTGDTGITSLFGGVRVSKSDYRIEACGTIDELTSWLGLIIAMIPKKEYKNILLDTQRHLYSIMAIITSGPGNLKEVQSHLKTIENTIKQLEKELSPLHQFILPGGTDMSAKLHVARAVARRAERSCVLVLSIHAPKIKTTIPIILQYMNRLSDLLFLLARVYNTKEVLAKTQYKK